jgi:hypothetical protein
MSYYLEYNQDIIQEMQQEDVQNRLRVKQIKK